MFLFWCILAIMIVLALCFVLWPLLKTKSIRAVSQDEINIQLYKAQLIQFEKSLDNNEISPEVYRQLKSQAEIGLLEDVFELKKRPEVQMIKSSLITAFFLAFFIPIISLGLYHHWGDSLQLNQYYFEKSHAKEINAEIKQFKNPQQLIEKLKTVLAERPNSAEGWFLLGRLYLGTEQYEEAENAFLKAIKFNSKNLTYKLQYAQANFFANNKKLTKKGQQFLKEVLNKQPYNPAAINLVALNAFSNKHYQVAVENWETLLNIFPANTEDGKVILKAIHEAQTRIEAKKEASNYDFQSPKLMVQVAITKQLLKKLNPNETVFVYAKSTNGSQMPLAIVKLQVKDLPKIIILSDASSDASKP